MSLYESSQPSPLSIWASMRDFYDRGGFVNGMNPTITRNVWYVSGNTDYTLGVVGSDGNSGRSPQTPFLTMARAFEVVKSLDIIVLVGVIKEQLTTPQDVFDVTIIGGDNQPRQATDGGVYTGGGASWLAPASPTATTPLVKVVEQSWKFINIQFAPVASSACIRFVRKDTAAEYDGSHGIVHNCYFSTGGASGIGVESIEVRSIRVTNCRFEGLGTGIKTTAGLGVATNHRHWYQGNLFDVESNDIIAALDYSYIMDNVFLSTNPVEGGQRVKLDGGVAGRNRVLNNSFSDVAADYVIAKGYKAGTSDVWRNWVADTNVPIVALPA